MLTECQQNITKYAGRRLKKNRLYERIYMIHVYIHTYTYIIIHRGERTEGREPRRAKQDKTGHWMTGNHFHRWHYVSKTSNPMTLYDTMCTPTYDDVCVCVRIYAHVCPICIIYGTTWYHMVPHGTTNFQISAETEQLKGLHWLHLLKSRQAKGMDDSLPKWNAPQNLTSYGLTAPLAVASLVLRNRTCNSDGFRATI